MWNIYSLLVSFLETALLFFFCRCCLTLRKPEFYRTALTTAALLSEMVQQLNALYAGRNIGLLSCMAADLAFILLLFQGKRLMKLHVVLFFYTISLTVEIWVIAAFSLLPGYSLLRPLSENSLQVAATLVSKAVILVLGMLLRQSETMRAGLFSSPQKQKATGLAAYVLGLLLLVFAVPVDQPISRYRILAVVILGAAGLLSGCLLIPAISAMHSAKTASDHQQAEAAYLNNRLRLYHQQLKDVENRLSRQEHDLRQQLSFTAALLRRQQEHPQDSGSWRFTGNMEVDAVIHSMLDTMQDSGVALTINGILSPDLATDSLDLCLLFSNLLENSFEAATTCQNETHKRVQLTVNQTAGGLFIKVTNPVDTVSRGLTAMKKNLRRRHGYGLKRIREIVDKYDGTLQIDQTKGLAQFHIYLKLDSCSEQAQDERRT